MPASQPIGARRCQSTRSSFLSPTNHQYSSEPRSARISLWLLFHRGNSGQAGPSACEQILLRHGIGLPYMAAVASAPRDMGSQSETSTQCLSVSRHLTCACLRRWMAGKRQIGSIQTRHLIGTSLITYSGCGDGLSNCCIATIDHAGDRQ